MRNALVKNVKFFLVFRVCFVFNTLLKTGHCINLVDRWGAVNANVEQTRTYLNEGLSIQ